MNKRHAEGSAGALRPGIAGRASLLVGLGLAVGVLLASRPLTQALHATPDVEEDATATNLKSTADLATTVTPDQQPRQHNQGGVASGCGPCPGDLTGNGQVGVPDLLELLSCWGEISEGCECADLTGNGSVGVADLLELFAAWGDCPEPTGACCVVETCSVETESDCDNLGGAYLGDGVSCDADPCLICGPGAGHCCDPNPTPGCEDIECCQLICAQDPFCCEFEWDGQCANGAEFMCDWICGPNHGDGYCDLYGCCGGFCPPGDCWCDEDCCDLGDCCWCKTEGCGGCFWPFCNGAPPSCEACPVPPGAIPENEPCGTDTNGGCNSSPPVFTDAQIGDVFHGTAWAHGDTRDTDWYLVTVPASGTVSGTVTSTGPQVVFILTLGNPICDSIAVVANGHSENCIPGTATASGLAPGSQVVVFTAFGTPPGGGIFDGFPCGSCDNSPSGDWEYVLEISDQ